MEFAGALPGPAGSRSWANDRRNRVDERDALGRVVDIGRREADG
jgi:hypothetical protein